MANHPNVKDVTDSSFDADVLKSSQLTLVDFWAEWCGPCKALAPTLTSVADQFAGKVQICKVNVDENPNTPTQFRIRGIPTIIFFKNGQMVDQLVGNHPKDTFINTISRHL
jgi:thioredoxin 1